jgi:hypothetical protein
MTLLNRLRARDLREAPFVVVLIVEASAVCYLLAAPQHWLRGVGVMAGGLIFAGLCRLCLTDDQAGMLRVRHRMFDVGAYWALSVAAIIFGLALPQR